MSRRGFSRDEIISPETQRAFDDHLRSELGDELEAFLAHPRPPEFVRVNPLRSEPHAVRAALQSYGVRSIEHPAVAGALQLERAEGSTDPCGLLHHFAGWYFKQSLGSMLPALLLDAQPGENILDLCASPGSKTTQIAGAMREQGLLWANDLAGMRMNALAARMDACGASNVVLINQPGERLAKTVAPSFDRILVDAPCSGLGDVANLPQIRDRFSHRKSAVTLSSLQYRLLLGALRMVRVGGRVVYSTCSLSVEENEAVVNQVVGRLPVRLLPLPQLPGLRIREGRVRAGEQHFDPSMKRAGRLLPWENPSEGFFVAVLEKTDDLGERFVRPTHEEGSELVATLASDHPDVQPSLQSLCERYGLQMSDFEAFRYWFHKDRVYMFAPQLTSFWASSHRAGAPLGRWRGGMLRLSHTAIQRFSSRICRNIVELEHDEMSELAGSGYCPLSDSRVESPFPVVSGAGLGPLLTSTWTGDGLRWKRARAFVLPSRPE